MKNGAFESSFATGLDLSEFGSDVLVCSSKKQQRSAAAELLRVKAEQAHQDTNDEREERWIHNVAKARGKQLLQAAVVHNYSNDEFGSCQQHAAPPQESQQQKATDLMDKTDIGATLVYIHGEDANGVHHKAKYKTKGTKRSLEKSLRLKGTSTKEKGVNKRPAVKKPTRSKY